MCSVSCLWEQKPWYLQCLFCLGPRNNTGIYAVCSMLQDVVSICGRHNKTQCFMFFPAHGKKGPKPRSKTDICRAIFTHLDPSLSYVGPSWGYVAHFWRYVGQSWSYVGPSWGYVGSSWSCVGPTGTRFGAYVGPLGPTWTHLETQQRKNWKTTCGKTLHFFGPQPRPAQQPSGPAAHRAHG